MFYLEKDDKPRLTVSLIAAVSQNGIIGKDGKIPWRSKEDLQYFKETTMGFPVIMGRGTWDSLNGKPLKGRLNIVLTKKEELIGMVGDVEEGPVFMGGLTEALTMLYEQNLPEVFIIGGGQIYDEAITKDLVDRMFINKMKLGDVEGDTRFPFIEPTMWEIEKSDTEFKDFDAYLYLRRREPEDFEHLPG